MKKLFVFIAALTLACLFSVSAYAANTWNFYGSARMATIWDMKDKDCSKVTDDKGEAVSDTDLTWEMQPNSRIGASVKGGDFGGMFEYGTTGTTLSKDAARIRMLFGTYNFGSGTLLVGKGYTPLNLFPSAQIYGEDTGLVNSGGMFGGRNDMIQLQFGTFKIALVEVTGETDLVGGSDVDVMLPQVDVSWSMKTDMMNLTLVGGLQHYALTSQTAGIDDQTVMGVVAGGMISFNFNPVTLTASGWYGLNVVDMGLWCLNGVSGRAAYDAADDEIDDASTFAGALVVGFKASDMVNIEAGGGYISSDRDDYTDPDEAMQMYVQACIRFAKQFRLTPEIGYVDNMDNAAGNKQGSIFYAGAQWRIDF